MRRSSVYALDPAAEGTLTSQLAENLRGAIFNGVFSVGDVLPGVRKMAELCGTSVQVPIDALTLLEADGLVKARPRIGSVVLGRNRHAWRGRVLLVHVGVHSNYGDNAFFAEAAAFFVSANWRTEHEYVPRTNGPSGYSLSSLRRRLSEKYDLVLLPAQDRPLVAAVESSGLPHMLLWGEPGAKSPSCVGTTICMTAKAFSDMADRCRERGVRRALVVDFDQGRYGTAAALSAAGIAVESIVVRPSMSNLRVESFASKAYDALSERLRNHSSPRPDFVFFADDYLARGGLWAISDAGLSIPGDMLAATVSNYGNAPFFPRELARIEWNPFEDAAKTVRSALGFLRRGKKPGNVFCEFGFVCGESL